MHSHIPDNQSIMEDVECPLGCLKDDKFILETYDRLHGISGNFSIVRCNKCGLVRTNPRPTSDAIGAYYPSDYKPYESTRIFSEKTNKTPKTLTAKILTVIKHRLPGTPKKLPPILPGRLLEIGCGSGSYLDIMSSQGWKVMGIEPNKKAAAAAGDLGYKVLNHQIESIDEILEPFDLIIAWMALEHLHHPLNVLNLFHQWTHNDSYLVFSVPDISAFEFRIFKHRWYGLQLPTHLYHYTPRTLKILLNESGWRIDHIIWHRNAAQLIHSLRYLSEDRGYLRLARILQQITDGTKFRYTYSLLGVILSLFRQSGRITVWAKRINT